MMCAGAAVLACAAKMHDWTHIQSGLVPLPADARSMLPETLLADQTAAEPGAAPARNAWTPTRPWASGPLARSGRRCTTAFDGYVGGRPTVRGVDGVDPMPDTVFEAETGGSPDPGRRRTGRFAALRTPNAGRAAWMASNLAPPAGTVLVSTKNRARAPALA